jgi:hypothetical protein
MHDSNKLMQGEVKSSLNSEKACRHFSKNILSIGPFQNVHINAQFI